MNADPNIHITKYVLLYTEANMYYMYILPENISILFGASVIKSCLFTVDKHTYVKFLIFQFAP